MYEQNLTSEQLMRQENSQRQLRVAQSEIFKLTNQADKLPEKDLEKILDNPLTSKKWSSAEIPKIINTQKNLLLQDLKELRIASATNLFDGGVTKIAGRIKDAEKNPSYSEEQKAKVIKNWSDVLGGTIDNWKNMSADPKTEKKRKVMLAEIIPLAEKLKKDKEPESIYVSGEKWEMIKQKFLEEAKVDKDAQKRYADRSKNFLRACEIKLKDKNLSAEKKAEIEKLINKARSESSGATTIKEQKYPA